MRVPAIVNTLLSADEMFAPFLLQLRAADIEISFAIFCFQSLRTGVAGYPQTSNANSRQGDSNYE
jgi:hypothetical protein